jgi:subtilase family serine protease
MRGLRVLLVLSGLAAALALAGAAAARTHQARTHHHPTHTRGKALLLPTISDWQYLGNDGTPPSQAACNAVGRRCFNPTSIANSYDYATLHALGNEGQGKTIAIVDSFGSDTIRQDLAAFNKAFGLPDLCGETGPSNPSGNCSSSTSPRFDIVCFQGCPSPTPPPSNNGTGQEAHNLWDLEVSLDVEWAHATAPLANIMLVTTPTAETLGVQGLQQMMNAEQYVIDNHMADVITQSFGTAEGAFHNGTAAIDQLRHAFIAAQANHVSVFASTGDNGTANPYKEPVKNPATIPYPSVGWPASDPLVTAVGGTYLCTDATTGTAIDSVSPPVNCQSHPGVREVGWIDSGGGYSILFPRPSYQNALPPGSTFTGTSAGAPGPNSNMRGIPDIAYQASSRTGVLVYMTEPATRGAGAGCGGANPCSTGWYVVGGTSSGSPQWAGIAAMADQIAGRDLGFLNPGLYAVAADPSKYAADYHDVTVGSNQTDPSVPGYNASLGWDAVTGLGTPDVARLIPDLIAATP